MRELLTGAVRVHIVHLAARDAIHGEWMPGEVALHGYKVSRILQRRELANEVLSEQRR